MKYERLKPAAIAERFKTEGDARAWFWRAKCEGKDWECPNCSHPLFYEYRAREVRECRLCMRRFRLRPGTILEHSKLPLITWARAISLVTMGKRGMSALELMRLLAIGSYRTAWRLLHKIRRALTERDEAYKLKGLVELDGAYFSRVAKEDEAGQATALIAVESKAWVDEKGRKKKRAGFAKVQVTGSESKIFAQRFVDAAITPGAQVNTDAGNALIDLKGVDADYQVMGGDREKLESWLPWVGRFTSNAKTWLLGTHHGVKAKYLKNYLGEYTWRFNRRHDPDSLFHRAVTACMLAKPVRIHALAP
jgi:hypothetical protein